MIKEPPYGTKVPGMKREITCDDYKRIEMYRDNLIDYLADGSLEKEIESLKEIGEARKKILKEIQARTFYLNLNKPQILTINELKRLS